MSNTVKTCVTRWTDGDTNRQPFLSRAIQCSLYTIPSLITETGHTSSKDLYTPYQSLGSRGVNNAASKLMLTLLPPGNSPFRLVLEARLSAKLLDEDRDPIESALSAVEQLVIKEMEKRELRTAMHIALKHLIVGGNVILHAPKSGSIKVHGLKNFVCWRDHSGNLKELLIKESVNKEFLPGYILEELQKTEVNGARKDDECIDLYTHCVYADNVWTVTQEAAGVEIKEAKSTYPKDRFPFLVFRWTRIDGENYGRGLVEDVIGDLVSLEALSKAIVEMAAVSARVIFLNRPGSVTDTNELMRLPNLGFAEGLADDITVLQVNKIGDLQVAKMAADTLEKRIGFAFMLTSSIQRNAERVTAEELRLMATEVDAAVGGTHAIISSELRHLVKLFINQLSDTVKDFPSLKGVEPVIVTGVDALGRSTELTKLDAFVDKMIQTLGPQSVQYLNVPGFLKKRAIQLGINPKEVLKDEATIANEQQAAMQAQVGESLGPTAIREMGASARAANKGNE